MEKFLRKKVFFAFVGAFSALGIAAIMLSNAPEVQAHWEGEGEGTKENPYQIGTKAELEKFRDIINGTMYEQNKPNACAILTADIDLEGSKTNPWTPIGFTMVYDDFEFGREFMGTFNGNYHKIYNLYLDEETLAAAGITTAGFFGSANGASISNLTIASGEVHGKNNVGAVLGMGENVELEKVHNYADVYATGNNVGGIVGSLTGSIKNSHNEGDVTTTSKETKSNVGGIAGYNGEFENRYAFINGSYNIGDVTSQGGSVGGIVGSVNKNRMEYNFNYGKVTGSADSTGGIFGIFTDESGNENFENDRDSKNNYYLGTTSSYGGAGNDYVNKVEKLTQEQFKDKSNFKNWDFESTWEMGENYPILKDITKDKAGYSIVWDEEYLNSLTLPVTNGNSITKDGISINIINGEFYREEYGDNEIVLWSRYNLEEPNSAGISFTSENGKILEIKITCENYGAANFIGRGEEKIWMGDPSNIVSLTGESGFQNIKRIEFITESPYSVSQVEEFIHDIGTVEYSFASKAKIIKAREAYNTFDDEKRALVSNYNELVAAENAYNDLLIKNGHAMIGDTIYETLGTAYEAANVNDTIVLRKDVDATGDNNEEVELTKSIKFDLNGHTLTIESNGGDKKASFRIEKENVVITIDNSKPETGGVIGNIYIGMDPIDDIFSDNPTSSSYVVYKNCRSLFASSMLSSNKFARAWNKIAPGFEIVDIENDTFKSVVRPVKVLDLSELTEDYVIQDGQTITGRILDPIKLFIADGATITMDDAIIFPKNGGTYISNGLTCLGDAKIIVEGLNYIEVDNYYDGIFVPENSTLTIDGTGKIEIRARGYGSGIHVRGNLIIDNCHLVAYSDEGTGIGSAYDSFESITINGGIVRGGGGRYCAGIGTGVNGTGGSITINGGSVYASVAGQDQTAVSIGHGKGGSVESITINPDVIRVDLFSDKNGKCIETSQGSMENVTIAENLTHNIREKEQGDLFNREEYVNQNQLIIGGVVVSETNNSGDGWSYDKKTNTLTLTDFNFEGIGDYCEVKNALLPEVYSRTNSSIIYYLGTDVLNIKLEGTNKIVNKYNETSDINNLNTDNNQFNVHLYADIFCGCILSN